MGAGPVIVCCVCDDKAMEEIEKPMEEAISLMHDEKPKPHLTTLSHSNSQTTIAPSR